VSATEIRTRAGLGARPGASTVPAIVVLLAIAAAAWVVSIARMALSQVRIFYRTQPEPAAAGMPYTPSLRDDSPGISAFLHVGDEVFHTYSAFRRGERLALAATS
jgi:Bacterial protein of unknown function (DUF899)